MPATALIVTAGSATANAVIAGKSLYFHDGLCDSCHEPMSGKKYPKKYCDSCLTRNCENCGDSFKLRQLTNDFGSGVKKYCSNACRHEAYTRQIPHNKGTGIPQFFVCEYCNVVFQRIIPQTRVRRFCSMKCNGKFHRKENHYAWLGDGLIDRKYTGAEYAEWRTFIFTRDDFECLMCKDEDEEKTPNKLEAHHIEPVAKYPEKILDKNNGVSLCYQHHRFEIHGFATAPEIWAPYLRLLVRGRQCQ